MFVIRKEYAELCLITHLAETLIVCPYKQVRDKQVFQL